MNKKQENWLLSMWAVALIATLGSLYFSEIKGYIPCTMCWYQRILMYPIVLIGLIALIQKNVSIAWTTASFAFIGGCISLYHYGIQKLTFLQDSAPVCGGASCTGAYINYFGFITIPFLALIAFAFIFIASLVILKQTKE
ncbi:MULTISPECIES: disulfide oxidoreductase [unclassified Sporosarcina]|uniref:disulfide oxidoreductase n=1 Tax=unclassified Sporosarcina TaxID=2647733 RepID=UPI000C169B62|nr:MULTISPECIES: disulfide oxidoreductase [unclassified Sporosarcina]PIC98108.1 disulfide bond formation protein B [Sporosarcina sp. P29]PID04539.1 disulfide bond formation protein B [Sporosarcina sp. P30]PID07681.1 disulfide bond formation protein B [Sporosarcina sp. P31]PID10879.1 disulfide bond formation protein B [Sporosarcina sp. P32b]